MAVTKKKTLAKKPAAGKKAAPAKKTAKKTVKKTAAKTGIKKGSSYVCSVCGLGVSVDRVCGCVDTCDIVCCGRPMKKK